MWYTALLLFAGLVIPSTLTGQAAQTIDEVVQTAVVLSGDEATLDLELASGRSQQVRFADGIVYIDGREAGSYQAGGSLESSWRDFLRNVSSGELSEALAELASTDLSNGGAVDAIAAALAPYMSQTASGRSDGCRCNRGRATRGTGRDHRRRPGHRVG
jgi:hypothetical protein